MKKLFFAILVLAGAVACTAPARMSSPDGRLSVRLDEKTRSYDVAYDGRVLIAGAQAQLVLDDGTEAWPEGTRFRLTVRKSVTEHIEAPFYRQSEFDYVCNRMTVDFGNGFGMVWQLSDDGVAYRFTRSSGDTVRVVSETAKFIFPEDWDVTYASASGMGFKTSFEGYYKTRPLSAGSDSLGFLPASVAVPDGVRVSFAESAAVAYPGAFCMPVAGEQALEYVFAPRPDGEGIALMAPADPLPWRIIKITGNDGDLAVDNLVYALAEPNRTGDDISWVRPGFSAWEWWNDWGLEGVAFKPGINDETYRYYIDFAAENGLEYVILDEGWGKRGPGQNLLTPIPGFHLQELVEYGRSRGVRLILWAVMDRLIPAAESVMATYEQMGIAGFKPDFLDRNDQQAVQAICALAETAARHHMILDIHGSFPPMGLTRTYPNIINVEGVAGLENTKWLDSSIDFMDHDLHVAYLRQMGGVCDYTPGAMRNFGALENFRADYSHPGSQGTRAHQVALYGVLDSPLAMLCDTPTNYESNRETTSFIASLPRNYSSKKVLAGVLGDYIVVERAAGDGSFHVFGLTDFTPREIALDLAFLGEGEWTATIFKDSTDAETNPENYELTTEIVSAATRLTLGMAPGGGFAVTFRPR